MNINEYLLFLINMLDTIVRVVNNADLVISTNSGLPSSRHWQVLYFVNVIKIFISFPTSVLVISHSVTFCLVTT